MTQARVVLGIIIIAGSMALLIRSAAEASPLLLAGAVAGTLYGLYVTFTASRK